MMCPFSRRERNPPSPWWLVIHFTLLEVRLFVTSCTQWLPIRSNWRVLSS